MVCIFLTVQGIFLHIFCWLTFSSFFVLFTFNTSCHLMLFTVFLSFFKKWLGNWKVTLERVVFSSEHDDFCHLKTCQSKNNQNPFCCDNQLSYASMLFVMPIYGKHSNEVIILLSYNIIHISRLLWVPCTASDVIITDHTIHNHLLILFDEIVVWYYFWGKCFSHHNKCYVGICPHIWVCC